MNKDKLHKARSSWILPSGEIMFVPGEEHDECIPHIFENFKQTENACIRVSCIWDYDAPISTIQLPKRITIAQARVLKDIEETLNEDNISIKNKIEWWLCGYDWDYILELA
jgi:hypothetical protein